MLGSARSKNQGGLRMLRFQRADTSHTVILIGATVFAGGLVGVLDGGALGQTAAPAPASSYPTPEFPTCVVNAPTDCRLPDGHPNLTGLWAAGAPSVGGGGGALASGATEQVFAGRGDSFVGFEADGGLFRETQVAVGNGQPQYKPQYWDEVIDHEYN